MANTHASRGKQTYKSTIKGPAGPGGIATGKVPPKKALNPSGMKQGTQSAKGC